MSLTRRTFATRVHLRSVRIRRSALAVAVAALLAGCDGGSGQSGSAFVFLSVDGFSLSGTAFTSSVTSATSQGTTTTACVTLRNNLKNPTITAPTALDNVIVQSYTVTLNGRTFTFGTSVLVPAGTVAGMTNVLAGNTATFAVIVVPSGAKGAGGTATTAEFTFRGRDGRGQSVEADGAVTVVFVAGAAESSCGGTGGTGGTNGNGGTNGTGGTGGTTT
jgi:hypothetical protein